MSIHHQNHKKLKLACRLGFHAWRLDKSKPYRPFPYFGNDWYCEHCPARTTDYEDWTTLH